MEEGVSVPAGEGVKNRSAIFSMNKPVILIVDDEPDVLNAVEDDLRTHYDRNYRIVKAGSGIEALEALEQLKARKAHVAVFVGDQRMPQMSSPELVAQA